MGADGNAWTVAGILTDLEGAVLSRSIGDGGLAGTIELGEALAAAANDGHFGQQQLEGERG